MLLLKIPTIIAYLTQTDGGEVMDLLLISLILKQDNYGKIISNKGLLKKEQAQYGMTTINTNLLMIKLLYAHLINKIPKHMEMQGNTEMFKHF